MSDNSYVSIRLFLCTFCDIALKNYTRWNSKNVHKKRMGSIESDTFFIWIRKHATTQWMEMVLYSQTFYAIFQFCAKLNSQLWM